MRLVEHRANQVVHRSVNHDEALHVGFLVVQHARHQHARIADHHAARLRNYLETEPANRLQERHRVFRRRRRLFLIRNPQAAAKVEVLQDDAGIAQSPHNRGDFVSRFRERRHLGYLRSDMRAEPDNFQIRQRARLGVVLVHLRERHAELTVAMTGGNMRMRPRVEVRIHPQADRRTPLHSAGDLCHAMKFRARLDIDHQDTGFQRRRDLLVGLADAGENNLARVRADPQTAHQLADRNDIEPGAHRRK